MMQVATKAPARRIARGAWLQQQTFTTVVLAIAMGTALNILYPFPGENLFLRYVEVQRPAVLLLLVWSYRAFFYSTPLIGLSAAFSILHVHLRSPADVERAGMLPPYPAVASREELFLVLGEIHHPLKATPAEQPRWLWIPERGLYTGIGIFGATGSGKSMATIIPYMRQLFGFKARDDEHKLSGMVLEVKGDLCRQLRGILREYDRLDDYVEIGLDSNLRYNPLHNDLEAYALAFNIASLLTNMWGRGKEPFWQQSYTDLVKFIIILHKVKNDYVTLFDLYLTAISPGHFESLLIQTGTRFNDVAWVSIPKEQFKACSTELGRFKFQFDPELNAFRAELTPELERVIVEHTDVEATVYEPKATDPIKREMFEAVDRWYWEHWKHLRPDIKTSVVQGISVFLSAFDTDPTVKRIFCPPKELYEGKRLASDPNGVVMPPLSDLIEQGKVCGLNFPVAMNPGLAKAIGTMMKQDFQRAVMLRIPKMDAAPEQYFRPVVFLCDEYQNFATVGNNDPNGDERFLSLSRQPKCIPIVASQSISSIREALPAAGYKTLLQSFRTKLFLTTSDPDTAHYASDLCGKTEKTRINYSVSETSNDANVGMLSGKASANKASVSASKTYHRQKDVLFDENAFYQLKNAQAIALVYDGITPHPPMYCFLKLDFLPSDMTWFEQDAIGFDPKRLA